MIINFLTHVNCILVNFSNIKVCNSVTVSNLESESMETKRRFGFYGKNEWTNGLLFYFWAFLAGSSVVACQRRQLEVSPASELQVLLFFPLCTRGKHVLGICNFVRFHMNDKLRVKLI